MGFPACRAEERPAASAIHKHVPAVHGDNVDLALHLVRPGVVGTFHPPKPLRKAVIEQGEIHHRRQHLGIFDILYPCLNHFGYLGVVLRAATDRQPFADVEEVTQSGFVVCPAPVKLYELLPVVGLVFILKRGVDRRQIVRVSLAHSGNNNVRVQPVVNVIPFIPVLGLGFRVVAHPLFDDRLELGLLRWVRQVWNLECCHDVISPSFASTVCLGKSLEMETIRSLH